MSPSTRALEIVYKDILSHEQALSQIAIFGEAPVTSFDLRILGRIREAQWIRVYLYAVIQWLLEHPNTPDLPESFHPDLNMDIKNIMHTGKSNPDVVSDDESEGDPA